MKYMLLIYGAEDAWTDDERRSCMVESMALCDRLRAEGKYLDAAPLRSVATAASVRVRDGGTLVTDGPFAETTEQLGGYYLLELADLDEAIAVAGRLPPAAKGTVEIRPLAEVEGLPPDRLSAPGADTGTLTAFLLLCYDEEAARPAAGAGSAAEAVALARRLGDEGRHRSAAPLHPPSTATCVAVRNGRRLIGDGPFSEAHAALAGYGLILAEDRDAAIRIAARHPGARDGIVEVRPLFDLSTFARST